MTILTIILTLLMITFVVGGINYYITRKIYQYLNIFFPNIPKSIFAGIFIFLVLLLVIGFVRSMLPLPEIVKHILKVLNSYWMGIFVYLLIFFLLTDIVMFLGTMFKLIPRPLTPGYRLIAGTTAILLTIVISCYGFIHARTIKYANYDISISNTDKIIENELNIVMISDIHLGAVASESRLPEIVEGINSLQPDLVCIAGDLFDNDFYAINDPDKCAQLFKKIDAAYGVWACLGNHDSGKTYSDMISFTEDANINVLNDDYTIIDNRFVLVGRLDSSPIGGYGDITRAETEALMNNIPNSNLPVIVMDHNPAHISTYDNNIDLILSGHTHRGQIFPGSLFTNNMFTVDYGYYQKDELSPHVIVSSGVGTWGMPMRVGTDCEIINIKFHQ